MAAPFARKVPSTNGQSLSSNTQTTVTLDSTETSDGSGTIGAGTSNALTATVAGRYLVVADLSFATSASNSSRAVHILVNGAVKRTVRGFSLGAVSAAINLQAAAVLVLAAGDAVTLAGTSSSTSTVVNTDTGLSLLGLDSGGSSAGGIV